MHVKIEKVAAWAGVVMLLAFLVMFWLIAGIIPPIDPSDSAAQVAARYTEDALRIRIGLALMVFFAFAWAPFWALLARQVRRIEGYWGVMSLTQILLGVTFPFGFSLCAIFAVTAAYRPDRNPDVTQALNDVFWFIFVGLVGPLITQVVILALAVLFVDKREVPSFHGGSAISTSGTPCSVFPVARSTCSRPDRWRGTGYSHSGSPFTVFCIWQAVTSVMLVKAVDVEANERTRNAAERVWEPAA